MAAKKKQATKKEMSDGQMVVSTPSVSEKSIPTVKDVIEAANLWRQENQDSWERAKAASLFIAQGEQWAPQVKAGRDEDRKETLTFNLTKKQLKSVQASGKNIDLTLTLSPVTESAQQNVQETNAFQLLLQHITLNEECKRSLSKLLSQCYSFGQSVIFAHVKRENEETLNQCIVYETLKDPRLAFFDIRSPSEHKNDGNYCGIKIEIDKKSFKKLYPKHADADWVKEENIIYDYWWRDKVECTYKKLVTGVYKREDLLTDDDIVEKGAADQTSTKSVIMYIRYINEVEEPLEPAEEYPSLDLPGVYNYGLTEWTPERGDQSYPYGWEMMDAQVYHNFIASTIATQVKSSTGDKYLVTPDHIRSDEARRMMTNINRIDGVIVYDKDPDGVDIRREVPQPVAPGMAELFMLSKQAIIDIAGSDLGTQGSEVKAIAGVALDKLYDRIDLLQNNVIDAYIQCVQILGKVVRGMIPKVYTEQRMVTVKDADKNQKSVFINQKLVTGKIANSVQDLNNNFAYEISGGVSTKMANQNAMQALNALYSIEPAAFSLTADVFARLMDNPYNELLSRRFSTQIDPMVIKYSNGEITQQQFMQYKQGQSQQAMQSQSQSPQAQLMAAKSQAESTKAQASVANSQAAQYRAETERMKAMNESQNVQDDLSLQNSKLLMSTLGDGQDRALEHAKLAINAANGQAAMAPPVDPNATNSAGATDANADSN